MMISITVTGKDRPGIVAALSGSVLNAGGNLEDTSMTILEGEFAMILLASLKSEAAFKGLQKSLQFLRERLGLSIALRPVRRKLVRGEKHRSNTDRWVVSVLGKDRSGIVFGVCQVFAKHHVNITDLNSRIIGSRSKASYALIIEVDLPRKPLIRKGIEKAFQQLEKKLQVGIEFHALDAGNF